VKAKPKKRRRRLSAHAKLVEARAASIPPKVVHDLFDTSTFREPSGASPRRPKDPTGPPRFVSKPPPPPPRPSQAPQEENIPEADLDELEVRPEADEPSLGAESAATQSTDVTSPPDKVTQTMRPTVSPSADAKVGVGAPRSKSRFFAWLAAALVAAGLGLTYLELRGSNGPSAAVEARAADPLPEQAKRLEPPASPATPDVPELPTAPPELPAVPPEPELSTEPDLPVGPEVPPDSETKVASSSRASERSIARAPASRAPAPELPEFDADVAAAAITAAFQRAQGCRRPADPTGLATVTVTYAPSGKVTLALVDGTFAGTPVGSCIAAALRSAVIPPYRGKLVTVKRSSAIK
jgi:hypothetical protein